MKKIKFLISTLFAVFFIVAMSDVAYAYDYKVTNKIVGETNDKSQDMKYMLMCFNDITISGADNVKSMGPIGIWVDCGFDVFTNENWQRHLATGCRSSGSFPYRVYSFSMKNNTTATLSGISGYFHLYRVYDSAAETNNQSVTYIINSRNYKNAEGSMDVCDIQSADGLKGIEDSISGSVVIYNSDGSKVTDSEMSTTTTTKPTTTTTAAKPILNKTKASVNVGKTVKLKVTNYKNSKVTWSSSNKKIATVTSAGKVKGIKAGKVTITAKVGKQSVKAKVTVKKKN